MPVYARSLLVGIVWIAVADAGLPAQNYVGDPPKLLVPTKPLSRRELDRREALKQYGIGALCERGNRLLEATRAFEEALKLDPLAVPVYKAVIPLYLALERADDALEACRKTVELDPEAFSIWYLQGRLHKDQGRLEEAASAMVRALACRSLKEKPDLLLQIASELGVLQEENKNPRGALAAYEAVAQTLDHPEALEDCLTLTRLEIDAKSAEIHERIGNLCLAIRDYDRALRAFSTAQKKDPEMAGRLNYHLARVRIAQDKPKEALPFLDAYLRTQPQAIEAYELKIATLRSVGRQADVLPQLKEYAGRDAHNLALRMLLARQYALARKYSEAETQFLEVIEEAPNPEAYRGLFDVYQAQGPRRVGEILELFDKALVSATAENAGDPGAATRARAMLSILRDDDKLVGAILPLAIRELGTRDRAPEARRYLAVLAARTHRLPQAERLYRECLRHLTPQTEMEVYGGLLDVLAEQRKFDDMATLCRKGLKEAQASNRLLFHLNLARALAQLGKSEAAVAEADEAVNLANDDNRVRVRLSRVRILTMADLFDKAETECQQLLKDPAAAKEIREIRYTLSGVYSAAKKNRQSEELLRQILEDDPDDDSANNDLGYIMADHNKNLVEAEKLIRKAIALDRAQKKPTAKTESEEPKDPASPNRKNPKVGAEGLQDHAAYIDSLGWVLFRQGRFDEARKELERAVALSDGGDDPVIWDHLGDVTLRQNDPKGARSCWQQAIKLYEVEKRRKPDDQYKELKQKLKLLDKGASR